MKKIYCLLVTLVLLVSTSYTGFTDVMYQESNPTLVVEGVNFIISTDSSDEISKDDLIEIAKSHEKNSTIIIHEVIYFEESIRNLQSVVSPLNWGVYSMGVRNLFGRNSPSISTHIHFSASQILVSTFRRLGS